MDERADHEQTAAPTLAGLTRVEIAARAPEPAIDWCRHEVRRLVAGHLLGTAIVLATAIVPAARWYGAGWVPAVAIGAGAGVVLACARVLVVLVAAPLGLRYVRRYVATPPEYVTTQRSAAPARDGSPAVSDALADVWELQDPAADVDASAPDTHASRPSESIGDPAPALTSDWSVAPADPAAGEPSPAAASAIAALREMGLWWMAAVRTDGRVSSVAQAVPVVPVVELFGDGDRIVAAVDRASGTVTLLTELVGFRVLVTSALLVPPTDDLVVNVVNVVDDDAPSALVVSHRRLVQAAFSTRALASDPVGLFKLAQQRELEAYRQLGPFWGAMLDLRCRSGGVRLLSAPSASDVLLCTGNRLFHQTR